ncbi:MAG: tRNA (adenosine(37)-N6)-threonylcarbamoyltransferase complex dimerization subunit type 1 TsaB [candidate division Zixibacteria bacterium]|nr:tRNA (adenosine(37)-N6)-threonylcarbamoyltransferase complex dimerization subunit type 1 TsaB [candidate division Zixibacteria bacterium]NIT54201.1 tRNA (adenosine(37)-N6)-threonylcarbamoyltransferase complex dimerization subunit type 1 TsaB [candidate division Zixibacteria bacterium]NIW42716.1 tRNA (adenosine(37)-N6)-threonylcarbamoyltransferase complex dimerization subunit type 1 TsaB [candidate division Zixibacteria bacterium]NIX59813.1 tRNA (adenosine(37)-N6)-threonylcarbamoyltransferase 
MLILCLDSSERILKTALFEEGESLGESYSNSMGNHSEKIISQIDSLFQDSSRKLADVDLLAINTGPGSFTGLRIGASAMAGLSISKNIPLFGFNAFEIMLEDIKDSDGSYLLVIPCRGDEFYYKYTEISQGAETNRAEPQIAAPVKIEIPSNITVTVLGPGYESFLDLAPENIQKRLSTDLRYDDAPTLHSLALLALNRYKTKPDMISGIPELYYMAPSQAEVNLARRRRNRG